MGSLYITPSSQQLLFPIIRILFLSWGFHLFHVCIVCAGDSLNINYVLSAVQWTTAKPPTLQSPHYSVISGGLLWWNHPTFCSAQPLSRLTKDLSAVIHSAHAWQEPRCPNFPLSSYFLSLKITQHMCEYLHSSHFSHHPSDVVSLCVWSPSLLAPEGRAPSQVFLDVKSFQCSVWPLQISEPDRASSSMPAGQLGWWVWDRQSCLNWSLQ